MRRFPRFGRLAPSCLAAALVAGIWLAPWPERWMTPPEGAAERPSVAFAVEALPAVTSETPLRVVERRPLPFETTVVYSDALPAGHRVVQREGAAGLERVVYVRHALPDGATGVSAVDRRLVRAPVHRVVVVGTARPAEPAAADEPAAAARAAAEGVASWYERDGLVAAHPTLPIGTRVRVTGITSSRSVTVVIDDRGPYIGGRIIDLSDDAFSRIAPLSAGVVRVRITW